MFFLLFLNLVLKACLLHVYCMFIACVGEMAERFSEVQNLCKNRRRLFHQTGSDLIQHCKQLTLSMRINNCKKNNNSVYKKEAPPPSPPVPLDPQTASAEPRFASVARSPSLSVDQDPLRVFPPAPGPPSRGAMRVFVTRSRSERPAACA